MTRAHKSLVALVALAAGARAAGPSKAVLVTSVCALDIPFVVTICEEIKFRREMTE